MTSRYYQPENPESVGALRPMFEGLDRVSTVAFLVVGGEGQEQIEAANDYWLELARATMRMAGRDPGRLRWVFGLDESYPVDSAAHAYASAQPEDYSTFSTRENDGVWTFLERLVEPV